MDSKVVKKSVECQTTIPEESTTTSVPVTSIPYESTTTPASTTTPEVKITTTPATTIKPYCIYNNFEYMPGQEIGKVMFNGVCYLVYCDMDSKVVKKSVECQTTIPEESTTTSVPVTSIPYESTTTPASTTTPEDKTTTTPVTTIKPYCIYNNFEYMPGQEIGKVMFNGVCYLVYCDMDSKVVKKSVECQTTIPEESTTTSVPVTH